MTLSEKADDVHVCLEYPEWDQHSLSVQLRMFQSKCYIQFLAEA